MMQKNKSFEPVLEKAMHDGVIKVSERIKIKDQIMFAKIMSSCGSCEPYLTFRDVKYFLGDECFKECIGKETYEKLKQLYSDNVDDEADKEITATAIGSPLMRSIFDLVEDAKELYKECEKLMNVKEEDNNEGNSDS
jgi:hypothetical protein